MVAAGEFWALLMICLFVPPVGGVTPTNTVEAAGLGRSALNVTSVRVDPDAAGLRFDGHGGLSAGGSSRLLIDYAEPYRGQILDYLYKPKFGASLQVCKVEIGGDTQATDGTEPSHQHTRDDLNCSRGYEFWLMKEAKLRNPNVKTYGLMWGAPGWINNQTGFYGPDLLEYQLNWLRCANATHGVMVDWLGLWNERPDNFDYMKELKQAISAAGFSTQIVIGDNRRFNAPAVMQQYGGDPTFLDAFAACGIHYPCGRVCGEAMTKAGKACWASEDLWTQPTWGGAVCWATELNQNFILSNMTSTLSWATLWSAYPNVEVFEGSGDELSGDDFWGPGLLYAWQPWSGHYAIPPTIWASAHTCQFSEVGWRIPFNGAGALASGGTYLTLLNPNSSEFSIVIETASATCHRCRGFTYAAQKPQILRLEVPASLLNDTAAQMLAVWSTNETHQFERLQPLQTDGSGASRGNLVFSMVVQPQTLYTITSTTGQRKGEYPAPPASAPFPRVWKDDFDDTADESLGVYWADQCGSFQVMPQLIPGHGKALRQRVSAQPGVNSWNGNLQNPLTVLGDSNPRTSAYRRTSVSVNVRLPTPASLTVDAALSAPLSTPTFVPHPQHRIFGRGYWQLSGNFTLSQAESKCLAAPQCKAIIIRSSVVPAPSQSLEMWLTADTQIFASEGWLTYTLDGPHPPPPTPPVSDTGVWAAVCGRITAVGQNRLTGGVAAGVCLQLNATSAQGGASFRLLQDGMQVLASGYLPDCHPIHAWTSLELIFEAQNVSAFVAGQKVAIATVTGTGGMVGLASGWHIAEFDDFDLSSNNSSQPDCDTTDLSGIWQRVDTIRNRTVSYRVQRLENSTYSVSSTDGITAVIEQGDTYAHLSTGTSLSVYGRVQGLACDNLRWVESQTFDSVALPTKFVGHPQHRIFGRGYWQIAGNFTLAQAEAKCVQEPQCKAITMMSSVPPQPEQRMEMWLTADNNYFAAAGWQTYVRAIDETDHPTQSPWVKQGSTLSPAMPPLPTQEQLDYQARELTQFMHFSLSTFAPINCSNGTRCVVKEQNCLDNKNIGSGSGNHSWNASMFDPENLDTDQWVQTASEWGAKEICLTAKHSGGFALWPTNALNGTYRYSVKYSPWMDGTGDVVRDFTDSCARYDIKPCFYFIADWNCVDAGSLDVPTYKRLIWDMVNELLTEYGHISRMWFDVYPGPGSNGWNPGGFPDEYRELAAHVKAISPKTLVLSGPDGCMAGHEKGWSPYPVWTGQGQPNDMAGEMCDGNPSGLWYRSEEVDFSIQNPGDAWFWHPNVEYMTAAQLWNIYMLTVGRGANWILNIPPNSTGVIPESFVKETRLLGAAIASLNKSNAVASVEPTAAVAVGTALVLHLPNSAEFDTVVISEQLADGQLIAAYKLELCQDNTSCTQLRALGGSVGHKVVDAIGKQTITGTNAYLKFTPTKTTVPADAVRVASLHVCLADIPVD